MAQCSQENKKKIQQNRKQWIKYRSILKGAASFRGGQVPPPLNETLGATVAASIHVWSRVSTHEAQNCELYLCAHGRLPGTLSHQPYMYIVHVKNFNGESVQHSSFAHIYTIYNEK